MKKGLSLLLFLALVIGFSGCSTLTLEEAKLIEAEGNADEWIHFAAESDENHEALRYLVEHGADINKLDDGGYTPLARAVISPINIQRKNADYLLEKGADINRVNRWGNAILHRIVDNIFLEHNEYAQVQYLVEHGADITLKNHDGKTPYDLAILSGRKELAIYLKKAEQEIPKQVVNTHAAKEMAVPKTAKPTDQDDELEQLLATVPEAAKNDSKWLFVIGIEQYEFTDDIAYARRSAEMFATTVQKLLGVPEKNSYIMIDSEATQAHIKTNLKKLLRRVKGDDTIYFYYNGHGIPVPSMKNAPFLMASNTEPDFIQDEKFFSLQNIYTQLSNSKADKVIAIVDSCFSGMTDGKAVLKGVAAARVVPKKTTFDQNKMVVLTAGKGHQYSNGYDDKGHRLFSYYIIKSMIEGEHNIKSLYNRAKSRTYETSLEEYGDLRVQEPTIAGNHRMGL